MQDSEPWTFTVVRAKGLKHLRPATSWRAIVTVEVDSKHCHETVLGTDGQNTNLRIPCYLHDADHDSQVTLKIWHRSESKRKGRKRDLLATACYSLQELLRKQELEDQLEVRLKCQSPQKRRTGRKGSIQSGDASIILRLKPPPGFRPLRRADSLLSDDIQSVVSSYMAISDTQTVPASPTLSAGNDITLYIPEQSIRKRRVKGFFSDDESCEEDCDDEEKPLLHNFDGIDDSGETLNDDCYDMDAQITLTPRGGGIIEWIVGSMLPQYTEKIDVPEELTSAERVLASFTMYRELKNARLDSEFDDIHQRLQKEWTYVGGLLVALAAVNTAVFAISPDSLFDISVIARQAIASSSIASGLGISCDVWFLLRYNWADLPTFMNRAKDVYGSYAFFALSARVPSLCMLASALTLMGFLGIVAFSAWPAGVVALCFLIGVVMTLQFLVYGVHRLVVRVFGAVRAVRRGVRGLLGGNVAVPVRGVGS